MTAPGVEEPIRAAALAWIEEVTLGGTLPVTREQLANDFIVAGARFPLVDRGRGIRKPLGWRAALSITTATRSPGQARPYADEEGPDGLHRYQLRRDQRGTAENEGLRMAMRAQRPIIWFYGLKPGIGFTAKIVMTEPPKLDRYPYDAKAVRTSSQGPAKSSVFRAPARHIAVWEPATIPGDEPEHSRDASVASTLFAVNSCSRHEPPADVVGHLARVSLASLMGHRFSTT